LKRHRGEMGVWSLKRLLDNLGSIQQNSYTAEGLSGMLITCTRWSLLEGSRSLEHGRSARLFARLPDRRHRWRSSVPPEERDVAPNAIDGDLNDQVSFVKATAEEP
jgi:hypothetical protein